VTGVADPLTFVVVGSAVPDGQGSPDQRQAAALVGLLAQFGDVRSFVLDLDGRQFEARAVLDETVSLLPLASGARRSAFLPQARWTETPRAGPGGDPERRVLEGWMSDRRRARLLAAIRAAAPDVVVIADPLLAPLGATREIGRARTILLDDGAGGLHARFGHGLHPVGVLTGEQGRWHAALAAVLRRWAVQHAGAYDAVADHSPTAARLPRPTTARRDARLLQKARTIVVPATGIAWLDRALRLALDEALAARPELSAEVEWILVGFEGGGPAGRHRTLRPWRSLAYSLGQAACIVAPCPTPRLADALRSALAVGTPVACPRAAAAAFGLDGLPGVIAHDDEVDLATLLGLVLGGMGADAAAHDAVAAAAEAAFGPEASAAAWQAGLSRLLGREVVRAPAIPPARRPRLSALAQPPLALRNPATRLFSVEVHLRARAGISEIEVRDASGAELLRLVPNETPIPSPVRVVEGGTVLGAGQEPGDLTLRLYRGEAIVETVELPESAVGQLQGEIAALSVDGVFLRGAMWVDPAAARDAGGWVVEHRGIRKRIARSEETLLAGTPVAALPFKLPLPRAPAPGGTVEILRAGEGPEAERRLRQRAPKVSGAILTGRADSAVRDLRGIHAGRRGWMLGNGPSVRLADLDAIPAGDVTFAFNRFHKSYGDTRLRENYVVSADTLMIADFGQEMIDVSAGLAIFCEPIASAGLHGPFLSLNPSGTALPVFSYDPAAFVSVGGSSVFVGLQMAHYMGIREMFLYGMDFHFNLRMVRDPRYPFPICLEDDNHFIKGYREAKPWVPPNWRDIAAGFINARVAFEATGGRIRNATRGGRLEIFPRIAFEEAVRG
jgi:hypothetical protein